MKHLHKYDDFLNEGLLDKMEPKSEEELLREYSKILRNIDNPLSEYPSEFRPKFEELSELLNTSQDDLHLISEEESEYNEINDFFESLVEGEEKVDIEVEDDDIEEGVGGTWYCYPTKHLAKWNSDVFDDPSAWVFSKNDLK